MHPFDAECQANRQPFAANGLMSAQQELPTTHHRFDDAQNRPGGNFSLRINGLASRCFEPILHSFNSIGVFR